MNDDVKIWIERADKAHKIAQGSGLPEDYIYAAELYELAGMDVKAKDCREAAERARWSAQ